MPKEVLLTLEGRTALEKELEQLKSVKRREISLRIKEAIALGDLSENAEYNEAKNEQAAIEKRIGEIEKLLRHHKIIQSNNNLSVIALGSTVVLRDIEFDEVDEYKIVGSAEANPRKNKMSNESPVGKAILGHQKGDIVEVAVPIGVVRYEIVEIK